MRIAYFHTNTIRSSWTFWSGASSMRRLGHEVLDAAVPTDAIGRVIPVEPGTKDRAPLADELRSCDRIVVAGPEYLRGILSALYGEAWRTLPRRVGIPLESTDRSDIRMPILDVRPYYDEFLWSSPSDAQRYGGRTLRPGIDIERFAPDPSRSKVRNAAFIGTFYEKRRLFLESLQPFLREPIDILSPFAFGPDGLEDQETWTDILVRETQGTRIHVDLPSNNPMPTSRPFETMACGTFLLTWAELPTPFIEGKHYARYDGPEDLANKMARYLADEAERESIAAAGCSLIRREFPAECMWLEVLC
jgi:hypothetical protein